MVAAAAPGDVGHREREGKRGEWERRRGRRVHCKAVATAASTHTYELPTYVLPLLILTHLSSYKLPKGI